MEEINFNKLYFNGKYYDKQYDSKTDDIYFWIKQGQKYGNEMLELGVGTGRLAVPLVKEGLSVTGIDMSDSMMNECYQKIRKENITVYLIKADIRDFNIIKKYDVIMLPANTITHLTTINDVEGCFQSVKKHLKPNGVFIIDVFNPVVELLDNNQNNDRIKFSEFDNPEGEGKIVVESIMKFDMGSQITSNKLFYKIPSRGQVEEILDIRIFFPQELEGLLRFGGFDIIDKFGYYDEREYNSKSLKQLLVCRLKAEGGKI